MSAERALLRRVKVLLECSNMEPLQRQTDLIVGEIKDLLAQSEQEPFKPDWVNYRQGVEDAKREPLSDEEIITAYQMLVRRKLGLQEKNEVLQLGVEE
jgi:hypothetical protein